MNGDAWTNQRLDDWIIINAPGFLRVGEVLGVDYKVDLICDRGHRIRPTVYNFMNGANRCRVCYDESRLWTNAKFDHFLKSRYPGCKRLGEVKNARDPVKVMCESGHVYNVRIENMKKNKGCKTCAGLNRRVTNAVVDSYILEQELNYVRVGNVTKSSENITLRCDRGHIWEPLFNNFIVHHRRCVYCYLEDTHNPDLTEDDRERNKRSGWRESVYARDKYTCQCCLIKGGTLNAHHLNSWNQFKDQRLDVSNGITLCETCHREFHHIYGAGNNTRAQYDEWIATKHSDSQTTA